MGQRVGIILSGRVVPPTPSEKVVTTTPSETIVPPTPSEKVVTAVKVKGQQSKRIDGAVVFIMLMEILRRYRSDFKTIIGGA